MNHPTRSQMELWSSIVAMTISCYCPTVEIALPMFVVGAVSEGDQAP